MSGVPGFALSAASLTTGSPSLGHPTLIQNASAAFAGAGALAADATVLKAPGVVPPAAPPQTRWIAAAVGLWALYSWMSEFLQTTAHEVAKALIWWLLGGPH